MSVVLACDLGGTSFRAALIDADGVTRAESMILGPTAIDRMGWSEIDATAWWRILVEAAGQARRGRARTVSHDRGGRDLRGHPHAGLSRPRRAPVAAGHDLEGHALGSRRRAAARQARRAHPETARINAFHPLARLAWLREEEEACFRALACVLEPKDYLNARLTGRQAGDPVSMARLLASRRRSSPAIDPFAAIGLPAAVLPPVLEPCERVGPVLPGLPAPLDTDRGRAGVLLVERHMGRGRRARRAAGGLRLQHLRHDRGARRGRPGAGRGRGSC